MLRMCVYMHSRFVENHPIRILEDGPLISEVVLSQVPTAVASIPDPKVGRSAGTLPWMVSWRRWWLEFTWRRWRLVSS
jgi:hypothetical protein